MDIGSRSKRTPLQRFVGRYGHFVEQYHQLETLQAVADANGVTRQRVHQVLQKMRALELYKYQPLCELRSCDFLVSLARARQTACTLRELANEVGYQHSTQTGFVSLCARFGVSRRELKAHCDQNKTEAVAHKLLRRCAQLPHYGYWGEAKDGYSATVLQHDPQARSLLMSLQRRLLGMRGRAASIHEVRVRLRACLQAGHVVLPHPQE